MDTSKYAHATTARINSSVHVVRVINGRPSDIALCGVYVSGATAVRIRSGCVKCDRVMRREVQP